MRTPAFLRRRRNRDVRSREYLTPDEIERLIAELPRVVRDPDDDHVLACALAASADLIVSGDPDLLVLTAYKYIAIVTPAAALRKIEAPT